MALNVTSRLGIKDYLIIALMYAVAIPVLLLIGLPTLAMMGYYEWKDGRLG